jgi:AsmA-like C-terminal region
MKLHRLAWSGCAWVARGLWTLVVWTAWLGLAVLLGLQAYVAATKELDVPAFVMRGLEQRLAASGVHARFGRTLFDPTGRILLEDAALTLPGFEDEVVTARYVWLTLDPWALLSGRVEPAQLRVTGAVLRVQAMISTSGRADELVGELDACLVPRGSDLSIEWLSCRLGGIGVSARGSVHLRPPRGRTEPLPVADFLARDYAGLSRRLDGALEALSALDSPSVSIELLPSQASGAVATVAFTAEGLRLPGSAGVRTGPLAASARVPVAESLDAPMPASVILETAELDLPRGIVAHRVRAVVGAVLPRSGRRADIDCLKRLDLAAADASGLGFDVGAPVVSLVPGPLPRVGADACATLYGSPVAVSATLDMKTGAAEASLDGLLSPGLLDPVGRLVRRDLHRLMELGEPLRIDARARFEPGWRFAGVEGRVEARRATVWHVRLDEARARVSFDGRRLSSPDVFLRLGDSFARGTYEQDVVSRDYRMILDGRLRPQLIGPWFPPTSWWHEFFRNFGFPGDPPGASADVRGSWANSRKAMVYVAVDSSGLVVRGVPFDRLRTRVFVRPGLNDGLFFLGTSGTRSAGGTFTRWFDPSTNANRRVDFDVSSTFDLDSAARIMGPKEKALLDPFGFDTPPVVRVSGRVDGPGGGAGSRETLHVTARSDTAFRFHDFPFTRVAFVSDVVDDDIRVDPVEAGFAGGTVSGRGRVWGRGADQRVHFDGKVSGASLGQAIATVETFVAGRQHRPAPAMSKFVKERSSVRVDVAASGEGRADDFLSYQGEGRASVEGSELGEIRMLGLLTQVLPFTSLRFTAAKGDFRIDSSRLVFSNVDITGANSAIEARGTYGLQNHQLDFNAKCYPFRKSRSLPQELIGGVLTPLSEFLEVKLTGDVENPSWVFEHGPTNFFRSLSAASHGDAVPPPASPPKAK